MSRTTARRTTLRGMPIAVVTGATVLCAGATVPALAHDAAGSAPAGYTHHQTFAEQKDWALRMLAHEADWLTGLKSKVSADDRLTADQKAAFTAKLDRALAQVAAARTALASADTKAELRAALARAELPYLAYPTHTLPTLVQAKAAAERFLTARAAWLGALRDRVSSDGRLTAAQKSRFLAKIDAALSDLTTAKDAVSAATTPAGVRAALAQADLWPGRYPEHHRMARHDRRSGEDRTGTIKLVSATQAGRTHRSVTVHRGTWDGAWGGAGDRHARGDCHGDWGGGSDRDGDWGRSGDQQDTWHQDTGDGWHQDSWHH